MRSLQLILIGISFLVAAAAPQLLEAAGLCSAGVLLASDHKGERDDGLPYNERHYGVYANVDGLLLGYIPANSYDDPSVLVGGEWTLWRSQGLAVAFSAVVASGYSADPWIGAEYRPLVALSLRTGPVKGWFGGQVNVIGLEYDRGVCHD